jgi:hypothetical protein
MYRVEIKLGSIGQWQRTPWVCATREEADRLGHDFVSRSTQSSGMTERLGEFKGFPMESLRVQYRVVAED